MMPTVNINGLSMKMGSDLHTLITVSASDSSFRNALERASAQELELAIKAVEGQPETKTRLKKLHARLKFLRRAA